MSEYVFRDASGYGCKPGEYERNNNIDHYGTLHDEIVRCRDCQEYKPELYRHISCERFARYVEPDGFCKWGIKK